MLRYDGTAVQCLVKRELLTSPPSRREKDGVIRIVNAAPPGPLLRERQARSEEKLFGKLFCPPDPGVLSNRHLLSMHFAHENFCCSPLRSADAVATTQKRAIRNSTSFHWIRDRLLNLKDESNSFRVTIRALRKRSSDTCRLH